MPREIPEGDLNWLHSRCIDRLSPSGPAKLSNADNRRGIAIAACIYILGEKRAVRDLAAEDGLKLLSGLAASYAPSTVRAYYAIFTTELTRWNVDLAEWPRSPEVPCTAEQLTKSREQNAQRQRRYINKLNNRPRLSLDEVVALMVRSAG